MIYCMSDIHGEYDRYQAMLELIKFSDADTLYILGDVIDRKPQGVQILEDIMQRPNVVMLMGNHEMMCLDELYYHGFEARQLWHMNDGRHTRRVLLYQRTDQERLEILRWLRQRPSFVDLEVNGCKFHLVHGYPADNTMDRIWTRPEPDAPAPMPGATVIVGHTPTVFLSGDNGEPFRIWYGDGLIDIDCGCGNDTPLRRLACLRLDDMQEFYI